MPTIKQFGVRPGLSSPRSSTSRRGGSVRTTFDRRPQRWDGARWVVWVAPERPTNYLRRQVATGLTMIVLVLIALALIVPSVSFALTEWFVIAVAVGAIAVYLHRQRVQTARSELPRFVREPRATSVTSK
jgi:hypothetical protein